MKWLSAILVLLCVIPCAARRQNTIRKHLRLEKPVVTKPAEFDTIRTLSDSILLSGYEKAQSTSTENVFVTNHTPHYISGINITIEYVNKKDEQLHKRTQTVKCQLPPGQTRCLEFKAWDKQHLWYYKHTQARHNEYGSEFDVRIGINYYLSPTNQ